MSSLVLSMAEAAPRARLRMTWKAALVLVCGLQLAGLGWLTFRMGDVSAGLSQIDRQHLVASAIADALRQGNRDGSSVACESDPHAALCAAYLIHPHETLLPSSDIWVLFDSARVLDAAALAPDDRDRLQAIDQDVWSQLNTFGLLDRLRQDGLVSGFGTNTMADAVLYNAALCRQAAPAIACTKGLPSGLSEALYALDDFVSTVGPTVAPYEMRERRSSATRLAAYRTFKPARSQAAGF